MKCAFEIQHDEAFMIFLYGIVSELNAIYRISQSNIQRNYAYHLINTTRRCQITEDQLQAVDGLRSTILIFPHFGHEMGLISTLIKESGEYMILGCVTKNPTIS